MRILVTGAGGNVGRGIVLRLKTEGHDLVLSDLGRIPHLEFDAFPFHQLDLQHGFGLERAAEGCDLILHCAAWHGIHWNQKTEADFWRLNVDGTAWMFQAARANGIKRVVFLSSQSWHGHYDKYGFTKRIGEELCEYHRQTNGIGYVAIRPHDFTPWGNDWVNRYGARLLYGGVDREDVMQAIQVSIAKLQDWNQGDAPGIALDAVRPNAFTNEQVEGWELDPSGVCDQVFPGSREWVDRYQIKIDRKPGLTGNLGWDQIDYQPRHHFGTFIAELRRAEAELGQAGVEAIQCPY